MNDAVTRGRDPVSHVQVAFSPAEYSLNGPFVTERFTRRPLLFPDDLPVAVLNLESGLGNDPLNLASVEGLQLSALIDEKGKLQAG